jgi:hypothetical protein
MTFETVSTRIQHLIAGVLLVSVSGVSTATANLYTIDFFPSGPHTNNIIMLGFLPSLVVPDLVGGTLDNARLVINFTTLDGFDAADLFLLLVARTPTSTSGGAWAITGADLGWSGQGNFVSDISTSELNGIVEGGAWTFDVYATVGDPPVYSGTFSDDTRFEITYTPVPEPAGLGMLLLLGCWCLLRRPR